MNITTILTTITFHPPLPHPSTSERVFFTLGLLARPLFHLETLILHTLQRNPVTTFRMFPHPEAHPYLCLVHMFHVLFLLQIPGLVKAERRNRGGTILGSLLWRPVTSRVGPAAATGMMLARVWVVVAWMNWCMGDMVTAEGEAEEAEKVVWAVWRSAVGYLFM